MPDRQLAHAALASYTPDGALSYGPLPVSSRWAWEFEPDSFTTKAAEYRIEFRPNGNTEAHVRGINRAAVRRAYEQACAKALKVRSQNPYLDGVRADA
ncbi:hypothetical protein [Streptomyces formicae]|nr:hypothetical protein [Streptomyces formicae]